MGKERPVPSGWSGPRNHKNMARRGRDYIHTWPTLSRLGADFGRLLFLTQCGHRVPRTGYAVIVKTAPIGELDEPGLRLRLWRFALYRCGGANRPFFLPLHDLPEAYRKPFADVTFFWAGSVTLPDNQPIEFRRYRPPPALRRGICAKCCNPVVGLPRLAPGLPIALVPSQNFPRPAERVRKNDEFTVGRRLHGSSMD
jgi:hypothetical protein